nr:T7SS effector LXG polymorphic toxin [Rummeliibacillus suwonensis]
MTKVLDVAGLQNGIEKTLKSLRNKQTEMAEIQKAVQGILALEDAFKGKSGDAIRAYYQEVHLPFISYYQAFIEDYESQLKAMDHELQKLESAKNGRIDEGFLTEDLKTSFQNTANRTITVTDEANQTILSIQDIVATPSLNDASFLEEVTDAQKQIQSTVEKVHQFDYNQSKALEELSNDVSNMQNYIDGIQAQMKSGKLQLANYTIGTLGEYQLDSWLKDEVGSTCSRVETEEVDRIEELQKKLTKASTPEEYLKIAKEIGIENLDNGQKQIVARLETAEGIQKGLLQVGKDFLKGIDDFIDDPGKSIEGTIQAIKHPIETYDYLSQSIADSFERDVINGDAESRAKWISYALGNVVLSAVGTKGLGAVSKTVKATTKVGVHKVKGAAQKIPTLNLYPYAPQYQLASVNAGTVPYNTVNSVGLRDQLISMEKVHSKGNGTKDTSKGNIVKEVKEIDFGKHIIKGENGKKQLLPNTKYATNDNYRYTTDELGRIVNVDAPELVLKKANRNKYAQANVGGKDRLPDDDGGHLIGAQFNGPPDIDNLVPQNSQINRMGGVWYEMETEWASALKEVPPKKVSVSIEPIYSNNSMRPDFFMVEYEIEGQFPVIREIANKSGG